MSRYRKLTTICAAAALAFGLAACGGGSDGDQATAPPEPPPPPPTFSVALPDGHGLTPGETTLPSGDTVVGDTTISCAGMDGCTLTVSMDPVTRAYSATATGGMITVAVAEPPPPVEPPVAHPVTLPSDHGLSTGNTTVAAGTTRELSSGTHIECAGTEDCTLTVSADPVTGGVTATSTGGMVTVTTAAGRHDAMITANKKTLSDAQDELNRVQALHDAGDATDNQLAAAQKAVADALKLAGNVPPTPDPEPPVIHTVELPDDHGLGVGDSTVKAGSSETTPTGATVACPADGEDCMLSVSMDAVTGTYRATSTGGAATVTAAAEPPTPTPAVALTLPPGNSVFAAMGLASAGTITIPAGSFQDYGGVRFSCPAGGDDCVVTLTRDLSTASATTGGADNGTATAGAIPNPAFAGSGLAGYLSNANLLSALRSDGSSGLALGAGFDRTGDGFSNAILRPDGQGGTVTLNALGGDPGLALSLGGGVTMDLYSTVANPTTSLFTTAIGAYVDATLDSGFWSNLAGLVPANAGTYAAGQTLASTTYLGATGTLACRTGQCSITSVIGGSSSGTGAWRFTPTAGQNVNVPDADYVTYGWWRQQSGLAAAQTDVVWAGSDPYNAANLANLTGTATYNGGAAGHYEERQAGTTTINRGQFTATAVIRADFGNDLISGTLRTFGGITNTDARLSNLAVNLGQTSLSGSSFSGGSTSISTTATPMTTVRPTSGSWNGQLFGNGRASQLVPANPTGVAGEFTALTGSTGMATGETGTASAYINLNGAFGAD